MNDPVISLLKTFRTNWTESNPGSSAVNFNLEAPRNEGTWTCTLAALRPPPEAYFTSGARRTNEQMIDLGSQPSRIVHENINVVVHVKKTGTLNAQDVMVKRWNMIEEVRRIVKTQGTAVADVKCYTMGNWQHDDAHTDPNVWLSRGVVTAIYFK